MMKRYAAAAAAAVVASLLLVSCRPPEEESLPGASQAPATPAPVQRAATSPAAPVSTAPADVRIDLKSDASPVPLRGTVEAYEIENTSQLVAGPYADAHIGDLVIANDVMKAVIGRPSKPGPTEPTGGHLVDLVHRKYPVDYINYMQAVADLDSTRTRLAYEDVEGPRIEAGTTAVVMMKGYVGERHDDDPDTAPLHRLDGIDVVTTYALEKNAGYMVVTTRLHNSGSSAVSLMPGDVIDWGQANTFIEGYGMVTPRSPVEASFNYCMGTADDFCAGVVYAGKDATFGGHTNRHSILQAYGSAPSDKRVGAGVTLAGAPKEEDSDVRPPVKLPPASPSAVAVPPSPAPAAPRTETAYRAPVTATVAPGVPTTETTFRPIPAAPGVETRYRVPVSAPLGPARSITTDTVEAKGGGIGNKDAPDSDTTAPAAAQPQDLPRLLLKSGESFTFTRYVVVSDADMSRVADVAYRVKGITTATVAGVVLESGTDRPVGNAEVRISGGPNWNRQVTPRAFRRAMTRADGTFRINLPPASYYIGVSAVGRQAVSPASIVTVTTGGQPQLVPMMVSPQSFVHVAVSDADTPVSAPLPCKVTFTAKPGTPPVDWGPGPDIAGGVGNVYYLPLGGARIPVTPGRYQVAISRGIEYDVVKKDIEVAPGTRQEVLASLPRPIQAAGLIAVDIGSMTSASAVSMVSARDRVVMAACEGIPVIVSGDYDTATDLEPVIRRLGLQDRIKSFMGMRFLVAKDKMAADVLLYPVTSATAVRLKEFRRKQQGVPPDIFLADLKKEFPEVVVQLSDPLDPEKGYLQQFEWNGIANKFVEGHMPPPDFDTIEPVSGKNNGPYVLSMYRYADMLKWRMAQGAGIGALGAVGGSAARLPFGQEPGYPRVYIYTNHDTPQSLTGENLANAIRGQHYMVTNGPLLLFWVLDPKGGRYSVQPGDVVDLSTTQSVRMKVNVLAAPWVPMNGLTIFANGLVTNKIEVAPSQKVLRYPVRAQADAGLFSQVLTEDGFVYADAFSTRQTLSPVVSPNPMDRGGPVYPLAWCAPIFIDKNGDGKVQPKR